jgi:exosortase D (VPLPA-CTERM-specific)
MTRALFDDRRLQLFAAVVAVLALTLVFHKTFSLLLQTWHREEYSHGFLIPLISGYLLWQRRARLAALRSGSSWGGTLLVLLGLALYFLGTIASITTVDTYALVVVLAGCALALLGWRAFKAAAVPLALLFLMNPMPDFFYFNFSSQMQLISSQIGVALIRLFGISVFLQGNVIDLGTYQLQVVEACSGLRYLFPLMTLGVVAAYLFKGKTWIRWTLFLSTVPITVFMNSFRIGVIGVLVEYYGIEQAEGFLHDFEGWAIFMVCFALLFAEAWLLARVTGDKRSLATLFALEPPPRTERKPPNPLRAQPARWPVVAAGVALLLAVYPAVSMSERMESTPKRETFAEFPLDIGVWHGQRDRIEQQYLDRLKLDDYLLADYVSARSTDRAAVNLYSAYYASQRAGEAAHSPRSCLPGGGWRIVQFGQRALKVTAPDSAPLRVNRAVITQGNERQLVYYWFQERGRDITNEYLVKWYMFIDAIKRNRSDGALVRLVTPLVANESAADGDARLERFAAASVPLLGKYLPN